MSQEAGKPKAGSAAPRGNPVGWAVGLPLLARGLYLREKAEAQVLPQE